MFSEKQLEAMGIGNWSDLASDFAGADLLLGNGFSLNLAGHFNYESLFKDFLSRLTENERKTFKSFGTNHFELIQEILINAKNVNKIFKITVDSRIEDALELLRNGLITSIQNNHPRSNQIDWNQLESLSKQLTNFGDIFTLNYDLFLYHIILQMKDKSIEEGRYPSYSDFFWGDYDERFKKFMDYDIRHEKHVYYLHGTLFIFKLPPDTCKLIRGDDSAELVEMIREVIVRRGVMPLFVSEGRYKEKLKAIERSNYLSFCYESFEKSKEKLVIFGSSLSEQDAHIAIAINYKKNKRELAMSIHIGNKSKDELQGEIKRLRRKFASHKISFFDSETIFKF